MADEMEAYRERIEKRYRDRRQRSRRRGGRRKADYQPPKFWTVGFVVQLVGIILAGLFMMLSAGCAYAKRTILGG